MVLSKSKLNKYLSLAGGLTSVTGLNSQVVYTDVNPDYVLSGNSSEYLLDLNNDSNSEFILMTLDTLINSVSSSYTYNIDIFGAAIRNTAYSNYWMITSNTSSGSFSSAPNPLAQGVVIGSLGQFSYASSSIGAPIGADANVSIYNSGNLLSNFSFFAGMFVKDQEGILGLRFKINSDIHFGWARIELTSNGQLSIKDYAYDATPNTAIIAGETGSGLVSVKENENIVQINNINNQLQVELPNEISSAQLRLVNLSGQEMISKQLNSNLENISLNELAAGIYIANVISNDEVTTKRIYVR